jgi:hypothetical protein
MSFTKNNPPVNNNDKPKAFILTYLASYRLIHDIVNNGWTKPDNFYVTPICPDYENRQAWIHVSVLEQYKHDMQLKENVERLCLKMKGVGVHVFDDDYIGQLYLNTQSKMDLSTIIDKTLLDKKAPALTKIDECVKLICCAMSRNRIQIFQDSSHFSAVGLLIENTKPTFRTIGTIINSPRFSKQYLPLPAV